METGVSASDIAKLKLNGIHTVTVSIHHAPCLLYSILTLQGRFVHDKEEDGKDQGLV